MKLQQIIDHIDIENNVYNTYKNFIIKNAIVTTKLSFDKISETTIRNRFKHLLIDSNEIENKLEIKIDEFSTFIKNNNLFDPVTFCEFLNHNYTEQDEIEYFIESLEKKSQNNNTFNNDTKIDTIKNINKNINQQIEFFDEFIFYKKIVELKRMLNLKND